MRSSVNEICEASQSGGEANSGTVQGRNQDLWVGVEGMGDVQVLCDEALEVVALDVGVLWWCF